MDLPSPSSPPPKNKIVFLFGVKLSSLKVLFLSYFSKNLSETGIPVAKILLDGTPFSVNLYVILLCATKI